jgi:hypothetical protein
LGFSAADPHFESRTRKSFAHPGIMAHPGAPLESVAPARAVGEVIPARRVHGATGLPTRMRVVGRGLRD